MIAKNLISSKFNRFMLKEFAYYNPEYAKKKVKIIGKENLLQYKEQGGVLGFLHFGSFFLSGIALIKNLGVNYTAIASSHNLKYLSQPERDFWRNVHTKINSHYSRPLFFTHNSIYDSIKWLKKNNFLGVAFDVIEEGRNNKLVPVNFLEKKVFFQSSPARLARTTNRPIFPLTIRFSPISRKHYLFIGKPQTVINDLDTTQKVLSEMETIVKMHKYQFFHDIHEPFQNSP